MLKKSMLPGLLMLGTLFLSLTGCKDEDQVPDFVLDFLTEEFYQELLDNGFVFNLGEAPPNVENIYLFEPENIYDNSGVFSPGGTALDTKWKFDNQSGNALDVLIKGWTGIEQVDTSDATIIKGEGNDFTILAEARGSASGISYTYVYALTGTLTGAGVDEAQFAFIMTDNPGAPVATEGTIRLFKDQDVLASTTDVFRMAASADKSKSMFCLE